MHCTHVKSFKVVPGTQHAQRLSACLSKHPFPFIFTERFDQLTADHTALKGCMNALQRHCTAMEQHVAGRPTSQPPPAKTKAAKTASSAPRKQQHRAQAAYNNALAVLRQQLEAQGSRARRYKRLAWQLQQQLCAAQASLLRDKAPVIDTPKASVADKAVGAQQVNSDTEQALAACRAELLGLTAALGACEDRCTAAEATQAQATEQMHHAHEALQRHQAALHALQV